MEYRRLGTSGLKLSEVSLGSWVTFGKQVQEKDALDLMSLAYDSGINFFDNAEGYEAGESEALMGAALEKLGWDRSTYVVSSKVFWGGNKPTQRGLSRKHVTDAAHAALKRLRVDYLDLFFCHRPDIDTPIEETVWAMHNLVTQGKILYWGTSMWSAAQITEAHGVARALGISAPVMEQPEYNLFRRSKMDGEFVPLFERYGLGTTTFSPLASGVLTGKYNDGIPADTRLTLPGYEWLRAELESPAGVDMLAKVRRLAAVADDAGLPLNELALLWCLNNPNVSTVILGASKRSQLEDNLAALDHKDRMTPQVLAAIEEIVDNKPKVPERF